MASDIQSGRFAARLARGFKGKLVKAQIRRSVVAALDARGNSTNPTIQLFAAEGVREDFSALYRAQAGIPDTDCKIILIAGLIKPVTDLRLDDMVQIPVNSGPWFQVRKILSIDPATASYQAQAYQVPSP